MQWSEVVKPPASRTLRQFAGLWLIVFGGMAAWRAWHGIVDLRTETLAAVAMLVGGAGLIRPAAVRWIYSGWMVVAFPVGWTVSRLALATIFYGVFAPIGVAFRLAGRDALRLRRLNTRSYWRPKTKAANAGAYFRQS